MAVTLPAGAKYAELYATLIHTWLIHVNILRDHSFSMSSEACRMRAPRPCSALTTDCIVKDSTFLPLTALHPLHIVAQQSVTF